MMPPGTRQDEERSSEALEGDRREDSVMTMTTSGRERVFISYWICYKWSQLPQTSSSYDQERPSFSPTVISPPFACSKYPRAVAVLEGALATLAGDSDKCPCRLSLLDVDLDESSLVRQSPSDVMVLVRGEEPYGIETSDLVRDDPGGIGSAELSWAC
jgi:hypothetical protein